MPDECRPPLLHARGGAAIGGAAARENARPNKGVCKSRHAVERTRGIWYNCAMKNTFDGIKEEIDGGNYEISPINFIISPTNFIISPINFIIDGIN